MYTFTIPREKFDERAPDKRIIRQLISKHISMVDRLKKNMAARPIAAQTACFWRYFVEIS